MSDITLTSAQPPIQVPQSELFGSTPAEGLCVSSDFEDFFENGTVPLHLVGPDGGILRANKAELDLLGYTAEEYIGQHIAKFHVDRPVIDDILARLTRGEKLECYPARLRAKDGSIKRVEISSSVQFRDGKFINTRCFSVDVTALRRAEDALREKERTLRQILDALPAAVYTTDRDGSVTYFNPAAEKLAGRTPSLGADQWCVTWRLRDPKGEPLPHEECPMAIALREKREVRGLWAYAERPDGSIVPFAPYPTPLFDDRNELTGAVNMLVDITDQKQREEQIEFVMHELSHRSKNLLTVVHSIALRTIKNSASLADFEGKFIARLQSMARTHDLLVANEWQGADIREIVEAELKSFGETIVPRRVTLRGDKIMLGASAAQNVNLAIHELTTNAFKHGVLAGEEGRIRVEWSRNGSGEVELAWSEQSAKGARPPERIGFGTQILQALFNTPRLDYSPQGFRFTGSLKAR
jgi:PAS domain S-box-containing protein